VIMLKNKLLNNNNQIVRLSLEGPKTKFCDKTMRSAEHIALGEMKKTRTAGEI